MLQQTTVPTVKTRFEEFIKKWPSNHQLAKLLKVKYCAIGLDSDITHVLVIY